ncbi:MAG: FG-GAP repeat protein [Phycisphaeraceae bacterium]|nr:MAG: FG-GAP repeat protein [Phycisphaeraceae bacterium]
MAWAQNVNTVCGIVVSAAMCGGAVGQVLTEGLKLTATDAAAHDLFGESVAVSGNTVVVGAYEADHGGQDNTGAAYVFDLTTGEQSHKLTAIDAAAGDQFGYRVAVSDTRAVIGSIRSSHSGIEAAGAAYVFDLTTGQQLFKLTAADAAPFDLLGISVAISGDVIAVGADLADHSGHSSAGAVYIFDAATGQQTSKLIASDPSDYAYFGSSVAVSGSTVVVGAHGDDPSDDPFMGAGAVYVFDSSSGAQLYKLTAFDAGPNDRFGWSVAASGATAVVGSYVATIGGSAAAGAAYVFDLATGEQVHKLFASDSVAGDWFGWSVGTSTTTAVIGAKNHASGGLANSGAAYVFDLVTGQQVAQLVASDAAVSAWLGASVSVDGSAAVVGAWGDAHDGLVNTGAAYVYKGGETALVFREADDASWDCLGFGSDCIPGWDHVGLAAGVRVWESHPGYPDGDWWDPELEVYVSIVRTGGVQSVHTPGSFEHDSRSMTSSAAYSTYELPEQLAADMAVFAASEVGSPFLYLCADTLDVSCWRSRLSPEQQKGISGGEYTCVGLVERSAEVAGHNNGQGFIPDQYEWVRVAGENVFPALSPQLLYWFTHGLFPRAGSTEPPTQGIIAGDAGWILTDPLGRRLGRTASGAELNEIPGAMVSLGGSFSQFLIPSAETGDFVLQIEGTGGPVASVVGNGDSGDLFEGDVADGQIVERDFEITGPCLPDLAEPFGLLDLADVLAFVTAFTAQDPGVDFDGNGLWDLADVLRFVDSFSAGCP